ncbi:MAG: hypothetical protein ACYTXC_02340 [Nostoc sp.]
MRTEVIISTLPLPSGTVGEVLFLASPIRHLQKLNMRHPEPL